MVWFPGPTRILNPNGISIGLAVFAGLTDVTDRQTETQSDRPTDHATRSVTIGRIYVRSTAMRRNNTHSIFVLRLFFHIAVLGLRTDRYDLLLPTE